MRRILGIVFVSVCVTSANAGPTTEATIFSLQGTTTSVSGSDCEAMGWDDLPQAHLVYAVDLEYDADKQMFWTTAFGTFQYALDLANSNTSPLFQWTYGPQMISEFVAENGQSEPQGKHRVRDVARGFSPGGAILGLDAEWAWNATAGEYQGTRTATVTNMGTEVCEAQVAWQSIGTLGAGDADQDGTFGSGDLVTVFLASEYQDSVARNSTFFEGDWNFDNDFDSSDLVAALQVRLYEPSALPARVSVPEPSGLVLLVVGLGLYARTRRCPTQAAGSNKTTRENPPLSWNSP